MSPRSRAWGISGIDVTAPEGLAERIWKRDSSAWGLGEDDPAERLGWLDLPGQMAGELDRMERFAADRAADERVALLGMGGSSLAPEVFFDAFGVRDGWPRLTIVDTTHPHEIRSTTDGFDLPTTSFIVSSKSGGTVETMSLYRHFRALKDSGDDFIAITDSKTPLERLAFDEGFGATWLNPRDIGGRFSALSYFGLVPAALVGADVAGLLDSARRMAQECSPEVAAGKNPGVVLGAALAQLANAGRDKLTFFVSPEIASFGDWVEQLIAESTGKRGRGIAPIVGEPLAEGRDYGDDRAFVFVRREGDSSMDETGDSLSAAGHPVVGIEVASAADLGAEMFRWEFATAVAGAMLGINAFDQPDVEAAKEAARRSLESAEEVTWPDEDPAALFDGISPPELAMIGLFAARTDDHRAVLHRAREKLLARTRVATSAGFGPRYLHSTGQLHKGGPPALRALIVLETPEEDVPIPGGRHGFARLVTAQAAGDAQALEDAGRRVARCTFDTFRGWTEA